MPDVVCYCIAPRAVAKRRPPGALQTGLRFAGGRTSINKNIPIVKSLLRDVGLASWHRKTPVLAALVVLALAGLFLRAWRLDVNPLWYTDECIYTEVARNLSRGELRYGALPFPFGREIVTKPPLWFVFAAPLQWLPGEAVWKGRLAGALASLLLTFCVWSLGRHLHSPRAGWVAAWVSLVHAPALLYGRWANPYVLAGLLNAACLLVLARMAWRPASVSAGDERTAPPPPGGRGLSFPPPGMGWAFIAGLAAGLSCITEFMSLQIVGFLALWGLAHRGLWRTLPALAAGAMLPMLLFLGWGMLARGTPFLRELASLLFQFGGGEGAGAALRQMARAFGGLFFHDAVMGIGLAGLVFWAGRGVFARRPPGEKTPDGRMPLVFLFCMLPLVLRRQGADMQPPHNLPAWGFAMHLGFAVALCETASLLERWCSRRLEGNGSRPGIRRMLIRTAGLAVLIGPVLAMTLTAGQSVCTEIPMGSKALGSVRDVGVSRELIARINADCDPGDIVVVPERLTPFLTARAVTWQQVLVAEGYAVRWYSYVSAEDLVFRPTLADTRLVVVDAWDRINGVCADARDCSHPLIVRLRAEEWRMAVFGEYLLYFSPSEF